MKDKYTEQEWYDLFHNSIGEIELEEYYIPMSDEIKSYGINIISVLPILIDKPNHEVLKISSWSNEEFHRFYVSIYEPKYIIDDFNSDISQRELEGLYLYTSTNWEQIIQTFKDAYKDDYNLEEMKANRSKKDPDKIIYPDHSPDYRLLGPHM